MTRLGWMELWDQLRTKINEPGHNSWGKNQILELMDEMERKMVRERELEDAKSGYEDDPTFRG